MHAVLIACPDTLELVPTGHEADTPEELAPENALSECPACGGEHQWKPADAVLIARQD